MKNILAFLFIIIVGFVASSFLPWWIIAFVSGLACMLFSKNGFLAFLVGFLGVAILWFGYAFFLSTRNEHILLSRMSELLPLHPYLLTTFIGGFVGGFSGLTGYFLKEIILKK